MARHQVHQVIQHLRQAAVRRDGGGLADGQLLERFITGRDETAFAALVRRHGPMVFGVCRRVLRHEQDAEDAFQATFLVLARKAASVTPRGMVANWLYGVAHKTALKAAARAARRKARERQVAEMPEPAAEEQDLWRDLQPLLDQELSRLPDKYRVAIVLCDLEGKTRKEAARQLGIPEGTLSGRLTRGRPLLAGRLARRGLVVSGGALAAVLARNAAAAAPAAVVSSTVKAASLIAAGQAAALGTVPAEVAALVEGVTRTMLPTKVKALTALALGAAIFGGAVGLDGGGRVAGGDPEVGKPGKPSAVAPEAERIQPLVRQLDSDDFAEREKATRELEKVGAPALGALRKAASAGSPEVRRRAADLLRRLEPPKDGEKQPGGANTGGNAGAKMPGPGGRPKMGDSWGPAKMPDGRGKAKMEGTGKPKMGDSWGPAK